MGNKYVVFVMFKKLWPFRRRNHKRRGISTSSNLTTATPQSLVISAPEPTSEEEEEVAQETIQPAEPKKQEEENSSSNASNSRGRTFPFHLLPLPVRELIWTYILPGPTLTQLPFELRICIWEALLPPKRTLKIGMSTFPIFLTDKDKDEDKSRSVSQFTHPAERRGGGDRGEPQYLYTHIFSTPRSVPVVLQICRESRSIGLRYYEAGLQTNALPSAQTIAEFMASRSVADSDNQGGQGDGEGEARGYVFSHDASEDIRQLPTPQWTYWSPSRDVLFLHSNFPFSGRRQDIHPSQWSTRLDVHPSVMHSANSTTPRRRFLRPSVPGNWATEFHLQLSHEKLLAHGAAPAAAEVFRKVQNVAVSGPLWYGTSREQRVRFVAGLESLRSLTLFVKELPATWHGVREKAWDVVKDAFAHRAERLKGVTVVVKYAPHGFLL